jgi:hypothetical protein
VLSPLKNTNNRSPGAETVRVYAGNGYRTEAEALRDTMALSLQEEPQRMGQVRLMGRVEHGHPVHRRAAT